MATRGRWHPNQFRLCVQCVKEILAAASWAEVLSPGEQGGAWTVETRWQWQDSRTVKLDVGDIAPDFTLPSTDDGIRLSEALGKAEKGVIVYFYPKAMTPGCATEACDFRDSLNPLKSAGYSVVGVSPDSLESLGKFARHGALNFLLASDSERDVMETYGAFGEKENYGKIVRGVIRSTFVMGKGGKIPLANYSVKAKGHVMRLHKELGID